MKKFLLVLSCCLATWCSVQAGPKSSPEISLMQASAPAAAPTYPAVINSATYNSSTRKVTVTFTVNRGSVVSFNLEATGKKAAQDVFTKKDVKSGNTYTVSFTIPKDWSVANAVVIKVDGSPCGGARVTPNPGPVPDPVVNNENGPAGYIESVSFCKSSKEYEPEYIAFKYNLKNADNPNMRIKEGGKYGKDVWQEDIDNTDGAYKNAIFKDYPSKLKEKTTYTACLYDGDKNLNIYSKDFQIPTEYVEHTLPEWTFNRPNIIRVKAPAIWPNYIQDVIVTVYSSNASYTMTSHHCTKKGKRNEYIDIQIPYPSGQGDHYIIYVTAANSSKYKTDPLKVCIW